VVDAIVAPFDGDTEGHFDGSAVTPIHHQFFDLLSDADHQSLVDHVAEQFDSMQPSTVSTGALGIANYDSAHRQSRVDTRVEDVWPILEATVSSLFPHLRRELGTGYFSLGSIERQLTVHTDGDFFGLHLDDAQPMTDSCRMITFVYYFNSDPKQFEGGELRLFDSVVGADGIRRAAETYIDIEPVSNSIVFFAADSFHEVRPVKQISNGPGARRCTVNGWFHAGDLGRPRTLPVDSDVLTVIASRVLPRLSTVGFSLRATPTDVHDRLLAFWNSTQHAIQSESASVSHFPDGSPDMLPLGALGAEVLEQLREIHEAWAGTSLRPIASYGLRVHREGQTERLHTERPETHIISSMLVIDQDVDTPWPLTVDLDARRHQLRPQPGQMLLYEGASTPKGHPVALDGRSYVVLFLHYCPVDWNHSSQTIVRAAISEGLIDDHGKLALPAATTR
jgi:Rps23 Pro-64 3,4-dihydroxylase Tpa1-like proline 4-hydroxylase